MQGNLMRSILILLTITIMAYSHSGRLDHNGGHTNQSNGKYHLHTKTKGTNINPLDTTVPICTQH